MYVHFLRFVFWFAVRIDGLNHAITATCMNVQKVILCLSSNNVPNNYMDRDIVINSND